MIERRQLIIGVGAALMTEIPRQVSAAPAAADIERRLSAVMQQDKLEGLHALLISQNGKTVFEHYEPGEDQSRTGGNLGRVVFGPDVPHDLRSVTKGVVGLLYGIAMAEGKVPPPEAGLYAQFPEYADLATRPGHDKLTVGHVLSMTMGLEWDELTLPYGDARNSETRMDAAPDRYRYILSLPVAEAPGTRWVYCGGATALLGRLIARGTGLTLLDYARRVLFEPMGFGPAVWAADRSGEPIAASGLRLLPRDMLKIGELILGGGAWHGRQLVPADWIRRITTPIVEIDRSRSYGYHWYMGELVVEGRPRPWIAGIGWGGQRLYVLPDVRTVVAINCGNYVRSGAEQGRLTSAILVAVVLPLFS